MDVASSVAHRSVPRLVGEVLGMLGDLALEGPSRAEVAKVQNRYAFDLSSLDDDPHGLSDFYGAAALWDRRVDVSERRRDVLALTPDDLRRAANVVFTPMRLNLLTVGTTDAFTRRALSDITRRFRERMRARTAVKPRPPVRVRTPIAAKSASRISGLLDWHCAPT
jgi:hypothetical protein